MFVYFALADSAAIAGAVYDRTGNVGGEMAVNIVDANTGEWVAGTCSHPDNGTYSFSLPTGDFKITTNGPCDDSDKRLSCKPSWWNGARAFGDADAISVIVGDAVLGIDLDAACENRIYLYLRAIFGTL